MPVDKLTKLNAANPDEERAWFECGDANADANFVTDLFYLTEAYAHFGLNRVIRTYMDLLKDGKELQKRLQELKDTQAEWSQLPRAQMQQMMMKRMEAQME